MYKSFRIPAQVLRAPWIADDLVSEDHGRWYAVRCQPNREQTASFHLTNQEFPIFLPLREKARRHARRIETVLAPFFPGYLFVRLDLTRDRWRAVNSTFGVLHLVMQGERPAAAPVGVIEALMERGGENGVVGWQAELKPGQAVRVLMGPFAELIGELEELSDAGRVRVLLNILGGRTPVSLPRNNVVPADSVL